MYSVTVLCQSDAGQGPQKAALNCKKYKYINELLIVHSCLMLCERKLSTEPQSPLLDTTAHYSLMTTANISSSNITQLLIGGRSTQTFYAK